MFNYSAIAALTLILMFWGALLLDTNNILHHLSDTMHMIENMLKVDFD